MLPPFCQFCLGEGSPTKIDYRQKGTLILTSLLEDLVAIAGGHKGPPRKANMRRRKAA